MPPRLIVADWEGGKIGWRIFDGASERHLDRDAFLAGAAWQPAEGPTRLVVEHAHLHERTGLSVAQVYPYAELCRLHEQAVKDGVEIVAFPQRLTLRARKEGGFESKEQDPQAIAAFIGRRPEVALKRWSPLRDDERVLHAAVNEIRMDMTLRLNLMRPSYEHPDAERAKQLLVQVAEQLSPATREQFGIKLKKKDGSLLKTPLKLAQIMALYVCVFDENGELRRNPDGEFIGMKTIWNQLLLMSPYHGRSGTARSNLMYHGLRNHDRVPYSYEDSPEQHAARRERWAQWRRGCKELLRAFRDAQPG